MGQLVRVLCGNFEDDAMLGLSRENVDSLLVEILTQRGAFFRSPMLFDKYRALGSQCILSAYLSIVVGKMWTL